LQSWNKGRAVLHYRFSEWIVDARDKDEQGHDAAHGVESKFAIAGLNVEQMVG